MMSGVVVARLLEALVVATRARRVLEIGTFTGYGALSIAARLPAGGTVVTLEADAGRAEMARGHIAASPDAAKVELLEGDARAIVPTLDGPFDLVFIDAWKGDYPHYYEAVLPKLADHGLIVCDNVLWGGDVVDPAPDDDNGRALAAFNDLVQRDDTRRERAAHRRRRADGDLARGGVTGRRRRLRPCRGRAAAPRSP